MEKRKFDVIVLGAGPGGYPAAIKAAQGGLRVAIIEAKDLGGTCLNRGCIPSKALIAGSETYARIKEAEVFGIRADNVHFDYNKLSDHKDSVVTTMRKGLEGLMQANKITVLRGTGTFVAPNEIKVLGQDNCLVEAPNIVIATGSEPRNIAAFPFDYKKIHDSTSLLNMRTLPKSIVVVGGGVIGCEFASLLHTVGVQVTILELLPRILPMECPSVSTALTSAFKKKGIAVETNVKVEAIDTQSTGITTKLADGRTFQADCALVSVGRKLNTDTIGLEKIGIAVDKMGIIPVNDKMQTALPGIYAVGDIASTVWLAHVATHQGVVAASNILGKEAHMHYNAIPSVIFTHPEIGTVGLSLEQAQQKGYQAKVGAFPFQALGKSQAIQAQEGFAQIVIDRKTGQILGAQVVGYEASTLVAEMAVAIANELTVECIADTIHAHPTISEAWLEAAFMAEDAPLHMPPKPAKKV